jgi:hypothetical protein
LDKKVTKKSTSKKMYIVRTYSAGCFFTEIVSSKIISGIKEVVAKNCRRLWYWKGAASLSQMAMEGVTCPNECKFSIPVETKQVLTNVIEVIECTSKATKNINGVPIWRA